MAEYRCHRARARPELEGRVLGDVWDMAPWTNTFRDIVAGGQTPYFNTRCKMLYDDEYFYVGAILEEHDVWGTLTEDQSIVFHDNDFEIFLDPDSSEKNYYEFEVNALGTTWQLTLDKPYKDGGVAQNVKLAGLKCAVHIDGCLNDPTSSPKDREWSVTVAIPLKGLVPFGATEIVAGQTSWKVNFSRVQWEHRVVSDGKDGRYYERVPPHGTELPQGSNKWHPEKNWVWSQQKEVNMHAPETWGTVFFT